MTHASASPRALVALLMLSALVVGACSSSTASTAPSLGSNPSPEVSAASTEGPSASPESTAAAASGAPQTTAVPTDIDPCQLVTADEASKLAGTTLAAAKPSTENGSRICTYGAEGIVLEVLVAVSPDAATAKAQEPGFKSKLEQGVAKAGMVNPKLTELPNFEAGVDAAVLSGQGTVSGVSVSGIALYALKGAVFLAISDIAIGGSAPSSDALQAQAHTSLGRLP